MPTFDHEKFFSGVREFLKSQGQQLTQKRVDALEFLISSFERTAWSIPHIAYALATIAHETAWTFEPIKEYRAKVGSKGRANQDRYWLTGYYGRGYVQLTWKRNYELFGIADDPDKALERETAFRVLTEGMRKGLFTGKKLSDFISDTGKDYKGARRIINGTDRAALIAGYANQFENILRASKTNSAASSIVAQTTSGDSSKSASKPSDNEQPPIEVKTTEVVAEPEKTVAVETTVPAGDPPDAPATQVTTGRNITHVLGWFGGPAAIATAVWGFMTSNGSAIATGMVCLTIIILAIIFRKAILDAIRMQTAADPGKKNVT